MVKEAVQLKKEAFRDMLSRRSPEVSGGSCKVATGPKGPGLCCGSGKAVGVGEVWRRHGEGLSVHTKVLLGNVCHLRRGKWGTIQAVYSKDVTLLTSTEEVIGRWKEHFEELLNPTTPSVIEAEPEADGGSDSISLKEVTEVVKQLKLKWVSSGGWPPLEVG